MAEGRFCRSILVCSLPGRDVGARSETQRAPYRSDLTYRARQRQRRSRRPSKVLLALLVLVVIAAIAVLSAAGYVLSVAASAPALESLKPIDQGTSSAVFAADGRLLGFIQSDEIRTPIPLGRIPESMAHLAQQYQDKGRLAIKALSVLGWIVTFMVIAGVIISLIFKLAFFYVGTINEFAKPI